MDKDGELNDLERAIRDLRNRLGREFARRIAVGAEESLPYDYWVGVPVSPLGVLPACPN